MGVDCDTGKRGLQMRIAREDEERFHPAKRGGMVQRSFGAARRRKEEERFLSAQADAFAGANAEEKVGLLRSK